MKKAISPWKVALLCLGASTAAQAGVNSWTNVGIHGAAVLEVQYVSAGVALVPAQTLTVQAVSSGSGGSAGGGGGGGGRLDYLLLAILVVGLVGRRRFGGVFRRVRKH